MKKNELKEQVDLGLSISKIAKQFSVSNTTIRYCLKKHGLKTNSTSGKFNYNNVELLESIVLSSNTYSECLRKMELSTCGSGSRKCLKRYINKYNIPTEHMTGQSHSKNKPAHNRINLQDILSGSHPNYSGGKLKTRLISKGILENKCCECGLGSEWNGKSITLQIDHIDGNSTNHALDNLRILCPNCHSQTKTYGSKNISKKVKDRKNVYAKQITKYEKECPQCNNIFNTRFNKQKFCSAGCSSKSTRIVNRPEKQVLNWLIESNYWVNIGKMFGVSDNSVRGWVKKYNLPN